MPKRAKELSPIELKRLSPGVHAVGGVAGLCLQVSDGLGRSWLLRTMVGVKRREIGLGPYPEIGLAMARQKASEIKEKIRAGIDPVEQRKAARAEIEAAQKRGLLFRAAVDSFEPIKAAELSGGKYRDQWRNSLDSYAIPVLGQMMVQDIDLQDILRVLEPIWHSKTVTADKLRRKLAEVLDYATVKGHRSGPNPARWQGNLAMVLSSPTSASGEENHPALQLKDAQRFWAALSVRGGMGPLALKFQTLTATRPGAVRFMTWSEVDLNARLWTVQPGRQSSKIPRRDDPKRVPLTDQMIGLLKSLPRQTDNDLVFSAPRGGQLSDATLAKLLRTVHEADLKARGAGFVDAKTGEVAVPHGTRSSFKVWASEHTSYDWNLSEAALWHKLGSKVEQAYARSDMVEKRRQMMSDWGSFLTGSTTG
jgi:integrase